MKTLNLTFDDEDYDTLKESYIKHSKWIKTITSWEKFFLSIASINNQKGVKRQ